MTTNFESIKLMSVEEMARFLARQTSCINCKYYDATPKFHYPKECVKFLKQWLEREVKGE